MTSILDIGINSLYTSRQALSQSHHNIANANNPFYSRRVIDLQEITTNIFGGGVRISDVRRIADEFVNQSLISTRSQFAFADKSLEKLNELEILLDSDATGISEVINHSLNDLNNLNANASSNANRNIYLQKLSSISSRFKGLQQSINDLHVNARSSIKHGVKTVNEILGKLKDINQQIGRSSSNGPENMPLFDQRDKLLNELAEQINFKSQTDESGVLNIQIANGIPLLIGNQASQLEAVPDPSDPMLISLKITNAKTTTMLDEPLQGGKIASLMQFQKEHLETTQNALGRIALGLADAINSQNKKGMNLKGELGQSLFTEINATELSNNRSIQNTNNQGSGALTVDITIVNQLTTSDYEIKFNTPTDYQLIRLSDDTVAASGTIGGVPHTITADGINITFTAAAFDTGDSILITPTRNASGAIDLSAINGNEITLAFPVSAEIPDSNQGDGKLSVTSIEDVSNPIFSVSKQLSPPIRIEFTSPTSYNLINASNNTVIEAGISYDPETGQDMFPTPGGFDPGFQSHLEGDIEAGDSFNLVYNQSGVGDNRNGLLLADIYKKGLFDEGELNLVQAYNSVSGEISSKTNSAQYQYESQEVIMAQAQERRDQISGVSIEEETLNLARFEQSYVASAQVLDVFKNMFSTIIGMMRN